MTNLDTSANSNISLPPHSPLSTLLAIGGFVLGGIPERKAVNILNKKSGALLTVKVPTMGDVVLVTDPAMVRSIFSASPSSLISGRFNAVLDFLYGQTSMFLVDGAPHHRLRRLLVPPFRNKDSLASYAKIIERVAEDVLDGDGAGPVLFADDDLVLGQHRQGQPQQQRGGAQGTGKRLVQETPHD